MLCYRMSLIGGMGSFSMFWVVGKITPTIYFYDICLIDVYDN